MFNKKILGIYATFYDLIFLSTLKLKVNKYIHSGLDVKNVPNLF